MAQEDSTRLVSILGVPLELGGSRIGTALGPTAIRSAGIVQRLEQLGHCVRDEGDLLVRQPRLTIVPTSTSKLRYLSEIVKVNQELYQKIDQLTSEGRLPLILGGDHSLAIGTLAGSKERIGELGVIWFDAHSDVNTASTTPSGNIHGMPLAVSLGYGHPRLRGIGGEQIKIKPKHTVIVGVRSVDSGEREFLARVGVRFFTNLDVERLGIVEVMERAIDIATAGTEGLHLSLDLDALDPRDAPGVGTPVVGGVTLRESLLAMRMIWDTGRLRSTDIVEVNPLLDCRNQTAQAAVELICTLLGERL